MEADLSRFHHLDYRDRWRRDEHGCRRLTLRMIWVRLRYGLPADSALALDDNGGKLPWTVEAHLIADLWEQQRNRGARRGTPWKQHPARPKPKKRVDASKARRLAEARKRRDARERRLRGGA